MGELFLNNCEEYHLFPLLLPSVPLPLKLTGVGVATNILYFIILYICPSGGCPNDVSLGFPKPGPVPTNTQ